MEKTQSKSPLVTRGKVKDKRAVILNAALTTITTNGFHGTSIKMIANEAKIATGTIYIYFTNKEEMIVELYEEIGKEINGIISKNLSAVISTYQNFINIWTAILNFYIKDPRKPEFLSQFTYSPYITSKYDKNSNIFLAPIQRFFEDAKNKKTIKPLPNLALITLTHSPITALVRMLKYEQVKLDNIKIEQYSKACWDAIKIN